MAELDTSGGGKNKGGKVRSKKQSTRVDLTAMVDLAFLLITFFMLTTRTMTILLGANNRLEWYMGLVDKPLTPPQVDNYGRNGIRKALVETSKKVIAATGDPSKGLIVLIKPSEHSSYRNFVDILDEMKVSNIERYAIVEISDPDIALLKRDGLYK
jgi:biopolymer transport protein ExbD